MNAKLAGYARQGGTVMLQVAPRVVGSGLWGAVKGFAGFGLLGGALALTSYLVFWRNGPESLAWSTLLLPALLAAAGLYTGAVKGLLGGLARQLVERKVVAYLYASVKPALVKVAKSAQGKAPPAAGEVAKNVRLELEREWARAIGDEPPKTLGDKVARFLALRSRRMLMASVVAHLARAKSGGEAVAELEKLGVQRLELMMLDTLEDLFSLKLTLILGAAFVISIAPQLIWMFTH